MSPAEERPSGPGSWLYAVLVLAVFAAVVASVRPILAPPVLYALLLFIVWPRIGDPLYGRMSVAATALMLLWVLDVTGLLLAPFILAMIFAYVLDPAVDHVQRLRIPRTAAVALLALPLVGVLALFAFVLVPAVAGQVSEFIADVPSYLSALQRWLAEVRAWMIGLGIEGLDERTLPRVQEIDPGAVVEYLRERKERLAESGASAVLGIGRGIGAVLALLGYLVVLPILTFYLLRDWDRIRVPLRLAIPQRYRDPLGSFLAEYDELVSDYLRGQLILALCVGVIVGVLFWVVDFPYPLLLGLLAGVLNVVPYLGIVVTAAVAVVISLFGGAVLTSLLKVAVVLGVEQVIEGIIGPKIVGESVGLHPVWVILSLAIFGFFLGFVGLLIAVPAAGLLKLMVEAAFRRFQAEGWYGADPGAG